VALGELAGMMGAFMTEGGVFLPGSRLQAAMIRTRKSPNSTLVGIGSFMTFKVDFFLFVIDFIVTNIKFNKMK
jgi:hypothetical protein